MMYPSATSMLTWGMRAILAVVGGKDASEFEGEQVPRIVQNLWRLLVTFGLC